MGRRKRFLLYSQHLSGSGHFVRTFEIARALAEAHEVYMIDGGRPVPRQEPGVPFTQVALPRIYRSKEGICPHDSTLDLNEVMQHRLQSLLELVERQRPDVLLIEHFPFSKWPLYPEIIPLVKHAREVNAGLKVICSLRDISPRTRDDPEPEQYQRNVLQTLHTYFDGVVVHADPDMVRIDEYIPWVDQITLPIEYTGYVSEKPGSAMPGIEERGTVIVSAGGAGSAVLISHCISAWKHPRLQEITRDRTLVIFPPLFVSEGEIDGLKQQIKNNSIELEPFTPDFINWMQVADISISEAGYNTCTNILETRTRAILVPNPCMSDQPARAQCLVDRGLATMISPDEVGPETLVAAILDTLSRPSAEHTVDLGGARKTRELLETL